MAQERSSGWVTVYYPTWAARQLGPLSIPPWEIDWTGITHVVHFSNGNVSQNPPYSTLVAGSSDSIEIEFAGISNPLSGPASWIHWQDSLVTIAHRHGVKVLLTIQAVDPRNLNYVAADSARTDVFAHYLVGYLQRKGYDGLELDWEGWAYPLAPAADVNRLIRRLRAALDTMTPRGLLVVAPIPTQQSLYWPSQDNLIDQYNLQCYGYTYAWHPGLESNASWYNAPLHRGSNLPQGFEGKSYDTRGPLQWVAVGHDPSKLGVGMPTFGYVLKDVDSILQRMAPSNYGYATYDECLALLNNGGSEGWDEERRVPFITGTAVRSEGNTSWGKPGVVAGQKYFATYENIQSISEKAEWVRQSNFGGIMLYDITMDLRPEKPFGERNPIIGAAVRAYCDPSDLSPRGSFTAQPPLLPPGGGTVTLSWSSDYASQGTITPAIGSVTPQGSATATLAATTTFELKLEGPGGRTTYKVTVPVDVPPDGAVIYDDSLHPGYANESWGVVAGFGSTEKVWHGRSSIRINFAAWGGFKIRLREGSPDAPLNSDRYDSLRFTVYSETELPLSVSVGSAAAQRISLSGGSWEKVTAALPEGNMSTITVQNLEASPAVVYVDNLYISLRSTEKGTGEGGTPEGDFVLEQNYPNPFNPTTVIEYFTPRPSEISLRVYNTLGELVAELASGLHLPGRHSVTWNAAGVAAGVYFCRLESPENTEIRKLLYLK